MEHRSEPELAHHGGAGAQRHGPALGGVCRAIATAETADAIGSFLTPVLLAFAGVSVFVGAFIIFNAFSITVAQRRREFAMLRALGAGRRQVLTSVVAWVSDAYPMQYTEVTAYCRAKNQVGGPLAGVRCTFVWHYKTISHAMTAYTNASGVAACTRYISGATRGYRVVISVTASYLGTVRSTSAGFTPY